MLRVKFVRLTFDVSFWSLTLGDSFWSELEGVLSTKAMYLEKGGSMTSSLRTGPEKVRSTFGKGTEYLFRMPLKDRSLIPGNAL